MSDNDDYSLSNDNDSDSETMSFKQPIKFSKKVTGGLTISDYDDDNEENEENEEENDDNHDNVEENVATEINDDFLDDDADDADDDADDADDVDDDADDADDVDNDDDDDDNDVDDDDADEDADDIINNYSHEGGNKSKKGASKEPKQNNITLDVQQDDVYMDEDEEINENYLQKFDKEITKNYIINFHPECLNHNYDEIKCLTNVTRDEQNIIIDPLHKTLPFLTKYEQARILGQRAKQIECGAKPLVKVPENIIDSYIIAKLELEQKKIPFIIRRPIPNGSSEYWNLKDLEMIAF